MEHKSGKMERNMTELGRSEKLMDMECFFMFLGTSTKASGNEIKLMVKENSPMSMDPHMMECGRMISSMEMVSNTGTTIQNMTEFITKETSMDTEATHGLMDQTMQVNGFKTELKGKVLTLGKTVESTKENGWTTTWKVMESTHGLMVDDMKVNILKIRNMDKEDTLGPMDDAMMASGQTEDNMESVSTQHSRVKSAG